MSYTDQMPPNLRTLFDDLKAEILSIVNCVEIGKISKVTPGSQTVEIIIQIKRVSEDGTSIQYPVLVDCPYFVLQGGGAYLDIPISVGDGCIVLFNDRNIDNWWASGQVADPEDFRKHSLSDALAIVGINPSSSPLSMDGTWVRLLGTAGPGSEEPAARQSDATQIDATTDSALYLWLTAVGTVTGAGAPPSTITGKISGGSSGVKIG